MIRHRLALAAFGVAAAHAAPLVTAIGPLRAVVWPGLHGTGQPGSVALTFDDGPSSDATPRVLARLRELAVPATFFLLGSQLEGREEIGREIAAEGHELAVHGWTHRNHAVLPPRQVNAEVTRATELIATVGPEPRLARPPYGALTWAALTTYRRLGLRPVLWTAWGRDWERRADAASVLATLRPGLRSGSTLLLHDSDVSSAPGCWRSALAALPAVVDTCREQGLVFRPLSAHLDR